MLGVLLASTLPDIDKDVISYLEKQANSHDGLALVEALADELGGHGQPEDAAPLAKLVALPSFERDSASPRSCAGADQAQRAGGDRSTGHDPGKGQR